MSNDDDDVNVVVVVGIFPIHDVIRNGGVPAVPRPTEPITEGQKRLVFA